MRELIVGTRNSTLAMIQTRKVIAKLREAGVDVPIHIKEIVTDGDKKLDIPLPSLGGGVFLEEIEAALLNGDIDFAVHSLKDAQATLPNGLHMACIPEREDVRDAYLANDHVPFVDLKPNAVIGTCSVRRAAQLLHMRPDIQTKPIRGPIDSRMQQMQQGDYDAIILAVSGIKRLGKGLDLITEYLPEDTFIPAIGQAALAIECREADEELNQLLRRINDPESEAAVQTERAFLRYFPDPDTDPVAGYAAVQDGRITLTGMVTSVDGRERIRQTVTGNDPLTVADDMFRKLSALGATDMIEQANVELGRK